VSDTKRVLVTGASGFVGRHSLRPLLERGFTVHAAARSPAPTHDPVTVHACDLLDADAATALLRAVRPSHLLHFAWYAVPGKFWTAPENHAWVEASLHLLRGFAAAGGRRAVVAGSCAEYDWAHAVLSEADTPLAPGTLYGAAKNALRDALERMAPGLGLSWAWGRLFWLYGPHEAPGRLVSDVAAALVAGRRIAVSSGEQQRDFMHVEDAGRAFAMLLDGTTEGAVNVASGHAARVRDVVARIGALTGHADRIDFGARPAPAGDPPRLVAAVERLAALGFAPRYDLDSGLAHTIAFWRAATLAGRRLSVDAPSRSS